MEESWNPESWTWKQSTGFCWWQLELSWGTWSEIVPGYRQPSPLQRASKERALLHEIAIIRSIFEWLLRNPISWNFEVNARLHGIWPGELFCLQIASIDPNPSAEYKTEPQGTTVCFKVINLHKELITCILKCLYLRYGNAWNIISHGKASKFFNLDPPFYKQQLINSSSYPHTLLPISFPSSCCPLSIDVGTV